MAIEEAKLTDENQSDIFKCTNCKEKTTRGEIRQKWKVIPFCKEDKKEYYCGCDGWC